ncbi:unnamed protein product [Medioppia subpectinata]|uniref:RING-type E3 ubiquitin transferase n=1 Tax=Medioppia subpectinata TaxID=1979941 RepID=A0A7R9L1W1_9ACAR|nr:unnamed protein product [Medioppia subpectinata]CAG2113995.1 unnamed protein product [Medioppia subpectinata]
MSQMAFIDKTCDHVIDDDVIRTQHYFVELMGNLWSGGPNGRPEESVGLGWSAYCYPPKTGQYFSTHFIMGGERFETCAPEAYLFGENMDLNFLGSHPTPFPYSAPAPQEPTRTLRALINIRKESLRLVRIVTNTDPIKDIPLEPNGEIQTPKEPSVYNLEFAFDADVKCAITVHYLCTEEMTPNGIVYTSKEPNLSSGTFHYKRGPNQLFSQSSHVFNPSLFSDEELMYRSVDEKGDFDGSALLPVVIHCVAQEGEDPRQSHTLIAVVERNHENMHSIKPLKQKLFVDGLTYLLQEIYGIENKNALTTKGDQTLPVDNDLEDNSSTPKEPSVYNLEFAFDADVKCAITVHYLCTEEMTPNGIVYTSKEPNLSSSTYHYKRGPNQLFSQSSHVFNPSLFSDEELMYRSVDEKGDFDGSALLPVVIHCVAQEGEDPRQSHTLIAVVERNHENMHSIKPLKQKLFVDGLTYLLQEIYGIENKNALTTKGDQTLPVDNDLEDNSSECVICMSDPRDTLILPCRHLCLCNGCADSLRYQANNCPICRAPFRALLQLKAVRKTFVANTGIGGNASPVVNHHQLMSSNSSTDLVDIPPGYEPISLIEALNGPNPHSNGLSPFRTNCNENETPITVRKYHKNDQKSKKANQINTNSGAEVVSDSVTVITRAPLVRSRLVPSDSPSTPEVVVSGIPVSPIKDNVDNELNIETNNEVKEREVWRRSLVKNPKPSKPVADDNGSASSSASSTAMTENIALQERVRLLSHDKCEDDCDYMTEREEKLNDETEMQSFRVHTISSPTLLKDSPGDSSPVSIGISSASYPMMSLRDGLDEQHSMDTEADTFSVATISSTNNILIRAEEDLCDYFIPYNANKSQMDSIGHNLNTTLIITDVPNVPQV